jgi:class 3 adenylate cyclase
VKLNYQQQQLEMATVDSTTELDEFNDTRDIDTSTQNSTIINIASDTQGKNTSGTDKESSLGQDLSSASLGSSKFDLEDTSELDELLQRQHLRGGCFGIIERFPLFCKLFLMLVVALVGLLALGLYIAAIEAKEVKVARRGKSIAALAIVTGELIHEIQWERDIGFLYLATNGSRMGEFIKETEATDTVYERFKKVVEREKVAMSYAKTQYLDIFDELQCLMPSFREQTIKMTSTSRTVFFYYVNCTSNLFSFMQSFTGDGNPSDARLMNSMSVLMQLVDNAATVRGAVGNALLYGMIPVRYQSFVTSYTNEDLLETLFRGSAPESLVKMYDENITPLAVPVSRVVDAVDANPYGYLGNISSFDDWWDMSTARINAINTINQHILSQVSTQNKQDMGGSIASITVLLIVVALLLFFSSLSAAVFSKAITGPWRRIIEVQQETITKFVPKGLLRTLKCYRLSDITLGKCVERELTIMFADIRNYTGMSETMTPGQNFNFLNKYLAAVGPIVRKHGGYIDKFMGDGIMACFATAQSGVKASLEMQDTINKLNLDNPNDPHIRTGIGLNTGRVIVGTIGENERMEGTMISDAVNLSSRLEALTKTFRAKVLVSSDTMKRLRTVSEYAYRPLGYVKVKGKKQFVKVYELLDRNDTMKLDTSKEFKAAVDQMIHHNFAGALEIMEQIVSKNPGDFAAVRVRDSCTMHYEAFRQILKTMQVHGALSDVSLREAFAKYMKDERSEENFKFWLLTEEYSNTADEIKRVIMMKKIFDGFLSTGSKHQVNTSDESKKQIEIAIANYQDRLLYPDRNLLKNLQTEVEILMADTFARFKNSSVFIDALKKTMSVPLVHIMDEDVL